MMSVYHWIIALLVALAVHAAALRWQPQTDSSDYGALAEGDNGIEIGLGQAGSYADQLKKKTSTEPVPIAEPKPVSQKPKAIAKTITQQAVTAAPAETAYAAKETPKAPERPEPEPEPEKPEPKNVEKPTESTLPDIHTEPATKQPLTETNNEKNTRATTDTVRATGRSSDKTNGGKAGTARSYFAKLMASLNHYKRYPIESKKQKQQGIVNVLFTIDQQGNVISRSIKKSSGHPQLDQAALAMFDAASPLPAIPEFMQRNSLTLVLPVDFSLITNNAFKE